MPHPSLTKPLLLAFTLAFAASTGPAAQQPKSAPKPLVSDNFESGAIDKNLWTPDVSPDAILTVQSEKVAHGKYALLARNPASAQRTHAFLMAKNLPEPLRHHLFGRAYVYLTPAMPDRHTIFLTAGTTGFPKYKYQEVATAHGKFQLTFVDTTLAGPLGEDWHAGPDLPLNRWFLLEWEFNDQPDEATIWVDGDRIFFTTFAYKSPTQSTGLVGGFTDFALGFRLWGAAPDPFDIYYDDVALDIHRLGPVR
jgi:hypothetical protein